MTSYYDIPIELIKDIHGLCEPECFGEFRIADARLYFAGTDYFETYKQKWLTTVSTEATTDTYKEIYTTFRGKFHGEYKTWHNNGQLCEHSNYIHGKQHGEQKEWYEDGQLYEHSFYIRGKLHGVHKEWYEDGSLSSQTSHANGILHGESKLWHNNGNLHIHSFYVKGRRQGEYKKWHKNGTLKSHSTIHAV